MNSERFTFDFCFAKKMRAAAVLAWLAMGAHLFGTGTDARPNFVIIMGEAQGWASSSVQMDDAVPGSKSPLAKTPALEKLAADGMRFANFYAASPRCTPTRVALFTGKSPTALHMTFVGEGKGGKESSFTETGSKVIPPQQISQLPESEVTIASMLKREGYATAHFGKWHVG
ncbi:MAG: sulfatase-like hydrolase/transferase, partial [Chthoniobacteraceae bacterium]